MNASTQKPPLDAVRVDKWLWAARFYKTRSLALQAIRLGQIEVNSTRPKASRAVRIGDNVSIHRGDDKYLVKVLGLAEKRGSASLAQALYEEDPDAKTLREAAAALRQAAHASNPIAPVSRPNKHARGQIRQFRGKQ